MTGNVKKVAIVSRRPRDPDCGDEVQQPLPPDLRGVRGCRVRAGTRCVRRKGMDAADEVSARINREPIIWDADFLFGPRDSFDGDTYVQCEINVSCVFAIPDDAPAGIAREMVLRLRSLSRSP
jgi:hypothetical protein